MKLRTVSLERLIFSQNKGKSQRNLEMKEETLQLML